MAVTLSCVGGFKAGICRWIWSGKDGRTCACLFDLVLLICVQVAELTTNLMNTFRVQNDPLHPSKLV